MDFDTSTFCVAPWFHIRNYTNMEKSVCCAIKDNLVPDSANMQPLEYLNSEPIMKLKESLVKGERPDACTRCWKKEDAGIKSLRNVLNFFLSSDNYPKTSWLNSYFKNKKDYKSDLLISAEVKVGNTCNHNCVMCSPAFSSLIYADWTKRKSDPFVQEILKKDPNYLNSARSFSFKNSNYIEYLDNILTNNKHIRFLEFSGGEPFLNTTLLDKLKALPDSVKSRLQIHFITNGSMNFSQICTDLGNFKSISCNVSIEGVGRVQEWARYGSDWKTLEKNIIEARANDKINISVWYCLQTSTILGFPDLVQWCNSIDVPLSFNIVYEPEYLNLQCLPPPLREKFLTTIKEHSEFLISSNKILNQVSMFEEEQSLSLEKLIDNVTNTEFSETLLEKFYAYIDWYESNKNIERLSNIFPELYEYKLK